MLWQRYRLIVALSAIAVLSIPLCRTSLADDKAKKPEADKPKVVVIQAKVEGDAKAQDLSKAVTEALKGKLDKLPADVRKKIEEKVKSIHLSVDADKSAAKPVVSARQIEMRVRAEDVKGKHDTAKTAGQPHVIVLKADKIDGKPGEKKMEVVVAAETLKAGDAAKSYKVEVKDGKVIVNGKPMAMPHLQHLKAGDAAKSYQVEVKDGKVIVNGKPMAMPHLQHLKLGAAPKPGATHQIQRRIAVQLDKAAVGDKKPAGHHAIWIGKDGEAREIDVDVVVVVDEDGKATVTAGTKPGPGDKKTPVKPQVRVRAMRLGGEHEHEHEADHEHAAKPQAHPAHAQHAVVQIHRVESKNEHAEAKTHEEVVKQLRAIEQELRRIRVLLEKMNK